MDDAARQRFIKLLGMTGSEHDGEALNALRMAQRLAADHKHTFLEMIEAAAINPEDIVKAKLEAAKAGYAHGFSQGKAAATPISWFEVAEECLQEHPERLTDWEHEFLQNYVDRRWSYPSERQRVVLERVANKCSVAVPAESD